MPAVFALRVAAGLTVAIWGGVSFGSSIAAETGWPFYGADQDGNRYSAAREITPKNVAELRSQWTFRTGDAASAARR